MRLLLEDGMQTRYGTGIGRYTEYLLHEYQKRDDVDAELCSFMSSGSKMAARLKYLLHINSRSFLRKMEAYDIVHFTNFVIPFRKCKAKYAVTVHDLSVFSSKESLGFFSSLYYRIMIRHSVKYADLIFTVSDTMRQEIMNRFGLGENQVKVGYSGIFLDEKKPVNKELGYGLEYRNYFLFVGTIEKRKNLAYVINAFFKMKSENPSFNAKLCLAGRDGYGADELHSLVGQSEFKDAVVFTGYISDEERDALYSNALAFVFPTSYEGFGVPQLECMKYGLPSLLSDIPVLREISGDYGEYFDLNHIEELADLMKKYIENGVDYSEKLKIAQEKLNLFTWENVAKWHVEAYNEVMQ